MDEADDGDDSSPFEVDVSVSVAVNHDSVAVATFMEVEDGSPLLLLLGAKAVVVVADCDSTNDVVRKLSAALNIVIDN